ncbi:MAG TPA: hypothetical protein PLG90_07615 [Ignavibacteria bacterium]|nr:hypothetical protein [Ignavibacteria bacterium]
MRINHFPILVLQSKFLNEKISGLKILEVFTQEKNILVFKLENEMFLEFSIEKNYEYLILKNRYGKSKKNVVSLFTGITDLRINQISILNDDRLICIYLEKISNCFLNSLQINPIVIS